MFVSAIGAFIMLAVELPVGPAPEPVAAPHFPDRLHAYVWRNWLLVPTEKLAAVVDAQPEDILRMGKAMGLPDSPKISNDQVQRSCLTIIKHNWHLLPYEQLLKLLDWTPEQMAYHLREDDFFYVKLGLLKPKCAPLTFSKPDEKTLDREKQIAEIVHANFGELKLPSDPPFGFIAEMAKTPTDKGLQPLVKPHRSGFSPRFCFSYFGNTGDPFLCKGEDIYPDGYLAQLAERGVDGVWLQGVLYTLAPFPWDPKLSERYEERLENVRKLVARAKKYGIGLYLYMNEPRAMPLAFFEQHPDLKGVVENDYATLCTSNPDVQKYIRESVASICRAVPDLKGFFTITASENLTNCCSHFQQANCPRCSKRKPEEVVSEVIRLYRQGIEDAKSAADLIVWDWGWPDAWSQDLINALPKEAAFMSVSEWSIPITRGGVNTITGEYSMSVIGPGPRAQRNWEIARNHGMRTIAKVQVGTTWELGSVPYIPVVQNVAQHLANLREAHLDGLMLSWTLGGYPSPNMEVVAEISAKKDGQPVTVDEAMNAVAQRRFGALAPDVVTAWKEMSKAFQEFPVAGGLLYVAPQHVGPSNPLWEKPTGYKATMVGFPYDDLTSWRGCFPEEVFVMQFAMMAMGFEKAIGKCRAAARAIQCAEADRKAFDREMDVAQTCAIHFRSVADQGRFVIVRDALASAQTADEAKPHIVTIQRMLQSEIDLAKMLYDIQSRDSRIGFEASNQYYYVPTDLIEKVINCQDLLDRWLPAQSKN